MKRTKLTIGLAVGLATILSIPANAALPLDGIIDIALSNSPALRSAQFDEIAARAQAGQARSAWMPQIKGNAQYARTDNPPQAFFMNLNQRVASLQKDFNNPDDTENLRLGVSAGWLLFDGGQRSAMIAMADLGADARGLAREIAVNRLVHDITQAYYGALQARDAAGVAAASVRSIEESRRLANVRVESGAAMKSDVLNLDAKLAEARQRLIAANNGYALAVASINMLAGVDVATKTGLDAAGTPAELPAPSAGSITDRPELKAARMVATIKQKALQKARRAYSPTISAFGEVDWDSDATSDFQQSYLAGVAAEIEVFDGSRKSRGVAQAKADYESARAAAELAQRQLELDLTQAQLANADAIARHEVAKSGTASAQEALRLARQRYEQGAADISELLNAETASIASLSAATAAGYEILIARSNLHRALGLYAARYATTAKE